MSLKTATNCVAPLRSEFSQWSLLPLLYHTKTIQRRYTQTERSQEKASREKTLANSIEEAGVHPLRRSRSRVPNLGRIQSNQKSTSKISSTRKASPDQKWPSQSQSGHSDNLESKRALAQSRATTTGGYLPFEDASTGTASLVGNKYKTVTPKEQRIFESLIRKGVQAGSYVTAKNGHATPSSKPELPGYLRALVREAEILQKSVDTPGPATETGRSYLTHVKSAMDKATSDVALWDVLKSLVFGRILSAQIDETQAKDGESTAQHDRVIKQFQVLAETVPTAISYFLSVIKSTFPGSPLGLEVLPALRKLGPPAFALGASTKLFNEHMALLFRRFADLDAIVETLAEMDREVYDFDSDTRDLMRTIFKHRNAALRGELGQGLRAFWSTDRKMRGVDKLEKWMLVVEERIAAATLQDLAHASADFEAKSEL